MFNKRLLNKISFYTISKLAKIAEKIAEMLYYAYMNNGNNDSVSIKNIKVGVYNFKVSKF